ncbi:MAG: hypothetical protein NT158_08285 [Cyanobacteria bacterium]|nr:hypothetical protein [Cyanobacteriota bacterium]
MSDLKRLPTSRAYWELKAEQMMNRIFDPDQTIDQPMDPDLPMDPDGSPSPHRPPAGGPTPWTGRGQRSINSQVTASEAPQEVVAPTSNHRGHPPSPWLWLALAGMGLVSTIAALLFVQQWTHLQQSLSQERNLLMVERLRSLGPANPEPMPSQVQVLATPMAPSLETVPRSQPPVTPGTQVVESAAPPPPPEEASLARPSSRSAPPPPVSTSVKPLVAPAGGCGPPTSKAPWSNGRGWQGGWRSWVAGERPSR